MNKYDPNIHHRRSIRLYDYDYSQMGLYFVTICTHDKSIFGEIVNDEPKLSPCGEIAEKILLLITSQFNNAGLHEYVIMPNHIHVIIEIFDQGAMNQLGNMNHFGNMNHLGAIYRALIQRALMQRAKMINRAKIKGSNTNANIQPHRKHCRAEKKQGIIEKLMRFFEKYSGLI